MGSGSVMMWLWKLLHRVGIHVNETVAYRDCYDEWCIAEQRCRVCGWYSQSKVVRRPRRF